MTKPTPQQHYTDTLAEKGKSRVNTIAPTDKRDLVLQLSADLRAGRLTDADRMAWLCRSPANLVRLQAAWLSHRSARHAIDALMREDLNNE